MAQEGGFPGTARGMPHQRLRAGLAGCSLPPMSLQRRSSTLHGSGQVGFQSRAQDCKAVLAGRHHVCRVGFLACDQGRFYQDNIALLERLEGKGVHNGGCTHPVSAWSLPNDTPCTLQGMPCSTTNSLALRGEYTLYSQWSPATPFPSQVRHEDSHAIQTSWCTALGGMYCRGRFEPGIGAERSTGTGTALQCTTIFPGKGAYLAVVFGNPGFVHGHLQQGGNLVCNDILFACRGHAWSLERRWCCSG